MIRNKNFPCLFTILTQLALALAIVTAPAQAQIQSSVVGSWGFDEGSGNAASDSSGGGRTAMLANGVSWTNGKIGGAVSADRGRKQFIRVPAIDLTGNNSITVTLWSKRTYSKAGAGILFEASNDYNKSTTGFVVLPDDATCQGIQVGLHGNVGHTANCYGQPSSGVWHYFAVALDKSQTGGNSVKFYIDGALQNPTRSLSAATNTNNFGNEPIYLFSRGGVKSFDSGAIDDLRIYRGSLNAGQVQRLYNFGLSQITKDVAVSVDGSDTMTTPRFTTSSNGEPLVAFVSYDGPTNSAQTASVSGGGLHWTLVERSNHQLGTAEIWSAVAPNAPFSATVTSQPGSTGYHGSLTVVGFANSSGAAIVAKGSGPSGAPDVNVPGVVAGDWVFAVGNDWDNAIPRTPVNGQVLVHQRVDNQVNDTYWVQSTAAPSSSNGAVDIHDSAPTSDQWNYAAVAMGLAMHGASYNISGTISGPGGPGATVTLSGAANAVVTADSSGNYTFTGLQNGNYTVTPSKAGFVYTPTSHAVTINGANVTGINFTSADPPTYSIAGIISGAGGPGATVTLSGAANAVVTADSGGNYTFSGLFNGNYTVTPSKAGYVYSPSSQAVTINGANISGVNFSSSPVPTYSISGNISGAGGPGATVTLTGSANAAVNADSSGNYSFIGLQNGNYTVTPSMTGFVYTPANRAVTINGANVSGVNFISSAVQAHWVNLAWTASLSQVIGYNVYRSNSSGGPYTKINSSLDASTTYDDQTVQSGYTYYYVTTAVDAQYNESVYSNQAVATIP